jgi:predicted NUDIX family phosphoesterase
MTSTPALKHQEFILAVDNTKFARLNGFYPKGKFTELITQIRNDVIIAQRAGLEKNPNYLQLLPYIVIEDDNRIPTQYLLYQRTKKVGEERLGGKFSIGIGGHVELSDMLSSTWSFQEDPTKIPVLDTLVISIGREIREETSIVAPMTLELLEKSFCGVIVDRGDEVGNVHIGLVFKLKVSDLKEVEPIRVIDPDLVDHGFAPIHFIIDAYDCERWTSLLRHI